VERVKRRLEMAERALATLAEVVAIEKPSAIERDAAIQRFEYTVEACWKAAQAVLSERYGVALASPKPVVRACAQNSLLTEEAARAALAMMDDRNLTSHTYNEEVAAAIHSRLPGHTALLRLWLSALAAG
jgi:nucleotidyltransferase substrate binding protein (TIGR01987 family)